MDADHVLVCNSEFFDDLTNMWPLDSNINEFMQFLNQVLYLLIMEIKTQLNDNTWETISKIQSLNIKRILSSKVDSYQHRTTSKRAFQTAA
jgi:hypothetical protein